jgi:hypothetical protein
MMTGFFSTNVLVFGLNTRKSKEELMDIASLSIATKEITKQFERVWRFL